MKDMKKLKEEMKEIATLKEEVKELRKFKKQIYDAWETKPKPMSFWEKALLGFIISLIIWATVFSLFLILKILTNE